jgi:hypothetical protein
MVRRTDHPPLQVRVSFEETRFSQQHVIEVYRLLVPTRQRTRLRPRADDAPQRKPQQRAQKGSRNRP